MAHQYKRRTLDEAMELGRLAFRADALQHLSREELEEMAAHGRITSGDPLPEWEEIIGEVPTMREYYQFEIYLPSEEHPYISKSYARMLVSRDRSVEDAVWIQWKPPVIWKWPVIS